MVYFGTFVQDGFAEMPSVTWRTVFFFFFFFFFCWQSSIQGYVRYNANPTNFKNKCLPTCPKMRTFFKQLHVWARKKSTDFILISLMLMCFRDVWLKM